MLSTRAWSFRVSPVCLCSPTGPVSTWLPVWGRRRRTAVCCSSGVKDTSRTPGLCLSAAELNKWSLSPGEQTLSYWSPLKVTSRDLLYEPCPLQPLHLCLRSTIFYVDVLLRCHFVLTLRGSVWCTAVVMRKAQSMCPRSTKDKT